MDSANKKMPPAAHLPEELIFFSILPHLPVRSLARFAAVCRSWRDLILRDAAFASLQARSPSPASASLARFHNGRLEVLTAPGGAYQRLQLCACTGGLLLLTAVHTARRCVAFCVVNPATRRFNVFWHRCPRGVAGLAYDPAAAAPGYDVVVAVTGGTGTCRFFQFSSRAAGSGTGWRAPAPQATVGLALHESIMARTAYAGGRVHWLTNRGNVLWHDVASGLCGALPPPPRAPEGSMDLATRGGRLRLACASGAGLGVWELAGHGGGGAARWEAVHWRSWNAVPGVVAPRRCFMWSAVPAGMEAGGEEAVGLVLRHAYEVERRGKGAEQQQQQDVWRRALVRYDRRTGASVPVVELAGKEENDDLGVVFSYHSSFAELPALNFDA